MKSDSLGFNKRKDYRRTVVEIQYYGTVDVKFIYYYYLVYPKTK